MFGVRLATHSGPYRNKVYIVRTLFYQNKLDYYTLVIEQKNALFTVRSVYVAWNFLKAGILSVFYRLFT